MDVPEMSRDRWSASRVAVLHACVVVGLTLAALIMLAIQPDGNIGAGGCLLFLDGLGLPWSIWGSTAKFAAGPVSQPLFAGALAGVNVPLVFLALRLRQQ